ncbi:alpha/beta hydrolase [Nocardioides campestrisoli]|uniref:alpha/beta hydrolase n=1 Tax=Nocardioides campestrisoli TaxID=2736757 RepID=UPI0015E69602|nr:alpha/beta hydrolase [Nocardioides campestrisoli]
MDGARAGTAGGRLRRRLVVTLVIGGVLVGGTVAMLWAVQRQLVYFPDTSTVPPAAEVLPGGRDVVLRTEDGLELGAWFVPAGTGPDAHPDSGMAVLVAPGNGGNRLGRVGIAQQLRERGFAVLLMDYRGYGGNPGSPSEDGLAADADAAVAALAEAGYPPERTVYLGESLGCAVVAALQDRHRPAAVFLRSPFTELADVGAHHYPWLPVGALLRDRFPVADHVADSDVPTTVLYGLRDSVVPAGLSAEVADQAERADVLVERVVLPEADHNDPVMFGSVVADAVARLVSARA